MEFRERRGEEEEEEGGEERERKGGTGRPSGARIKTSDRPKFTTCSSSWSAHPKTPNFHNTR
eukprot:1624698-Pyramimonas_sp.AAC.1